MGRPRRTVSWWYLRGRKRSREEGAGFWWVGGWRHMQAACGPAGRWRGRRPSQAGVRRYGARDTCRRTRDICKSPHTQHKLAPVRRAGGFGPPARGCARVGPVGRRGAMSFLDHYPGPSRAGGPGRSAAGLSRTSSMPVGPPWQTPRAANPGHPALPNPIGPFRTPRELRPAPAPPLQRLLPQSLLPAGQCSKKQAEGFRRLS